MREYEVWLRPWVRYTWDGYKFEESPDGFSLHTTPEHAGYFEKSHKNKLPALLPNEYSIAKGEASKIKVDEQIHQQILEGRFGARFDQRKSPNGSPVWVIRTQT